MAVSNAYKFPAQPGWTWQGLNAARQPIDTADPGMEMQPPDPRDRMPNVGYGPGYNAGLVPAASQNQLLSPDTFDKYQQGQLNTLAPPPLAGSMFDRATQNAPGLLDPGNINIHQRPIVRNADGSISTVRSMTFSNPDGSAVVVPSVIDGRGIVGPVEAYKYYQQTGQHLGRFSTQEAADAYAQALHEQQATEYAR